MRLLQLDRDWVGASPRLGLLFSSGVLISGVASLLNEVVWQRALQRFLGGSEALSSMLVVAAFMLGLGVGAIAGGRYAGRFQRPLRALALVEAAIAGTTLLIAVGLDGGRTDSIVELQLSAVHAGLPVTVVFGCLAGMILTVPCFLIGATMPLAGEALQRALGAQDSRALGLLFGVNTLGAAAGALAAGYVLVPLIGITSSLYGAVAFNLVAAVIFATGGGGRSREPEAVGPGGSAVMPNALRGAATVRASVLTMLILGFCSLGYEMALLRLFALQRGPLPYTFAMVVTGFLIAWSLGAALSSRAKSANVARLAGACAVALVLPLGAFYLWWLSAGFGIPAGPTQVFYRLLRWLLTAGCFLPCGLFGFMFGAVAARAVRVWGRDVGSLHAANTAGAVTGVLVILLVGYELPFAVLIGGLAAILLLLKYLESCMPGARYARRPAVDRFPGGGRFLAAGAAAAAIAVVWAAGIWLDSGISLSFSRAGVLGLDRGGNLYWDGLWHSRLADGESYIGTNNWNLAALPAVSYSGPGIRDVCVIGLGTGITAAVIAQLETVRKVDVYEINRGLEEFHRRHPEGTMRALDNSKIEIRWQDARAGLRIRDERYDLIITQPMYLKQAGSAFLNSREFMEIVRSRLNPGGVFCVYSRGTEAQTLVMRQTADRVFTHGHSFLDGYLLVLSDQSLDLSQEALEKRFLEYGADPLWRQMAANSETESPAAVRSILDDPRLGWRAWGLEVTDDEPIIEYPGMLERRLNWAASSSR